VFYLRVSALSQFSPLSSSQREKSGSIRTRASTLSSGFLASFSPSVSLKKMKTLTKSVSSKSLLVRTSKRSYRKTVRNFFGSPNNRGSTGSSLWCDTLGDNKEKVLKGLKKNEIRRQEVIFELTTGEEQYLEDLKNVVKVFSEPMRLLNIITELEQKSIFANITELVHLHEGQ
jgi:hypothetical protein